MALLDIRDLSFSYPDESRPALKSLSFTIDEGECVLLTGSSGCGKSTLLKLIKYLTAPAGRMRGEILYHGKRVEDYLPLTLSQEIGFVFQNPDNQIVMDHVLQELVFGMENMGYEPAFMKRRVAELVHFFGFEPWLEKNTSEMSSGQKQMINLASVLLLNPKLLLLDEPTSQLDPVAAKQFLSVIEQLNQEFGITVILAEHRIEELYRIADRVIMLDEGRLEQMGAPREVARRLWEEDKKRKRRYVPSVAGLFFSVEEHRRQTAEIPLSVREGRRWLDAYVLTPDWQRKKKQCVENKENDEGGKDSQKPLLKNAGVKSENPVLSAKNLCFRYSKTGRDVLRDLSLDVMAGEWLTIVGSNGSGKSTLLKLLAGLLKSQHGKTFLKGKRLLKPDARHIGYLPQNPKLYFLQDTVRKEMEGLAARFKLPDGETKIDQWLSVFQLKGLENRHPYDLSGGELQKAALACISLTEPDVLLVDEPTKGLDPDAKYLLAQVLTSLHESGRTIVMATHDVEYAAKYAGSCAMMFQGKVGPPEAPRRFFKENTFYTTVLDRMTRRSGFPEVLTLEEAENQLFF